MSYEACEAALQSSLESIETPKIGAVALGDYTVANKGVSCFLVLRSAGMTQTAETFDSLALATWMIDIEMLVRNTTPEAARKLQRTLRQAIIDEVNAHPRLGGAAFNSLITKGRVGNEEYVMGQVRFLQEFMTCEVQEAIDTVAED